MLKPIANFFNTIAFLFRMIFKFFKFVLMLTGVISFPRCGNSGYSKEGGKTFYNGKEMGKDFVVLNEVFAKDDSCAYFKTHRISDADIATFTALGLQYAKDKNAAYYCDEYREGKNYFLTKGVTIQRIELDNPASFVVLGDAYSNYAKDSQRGYLKGTGFAVKDPASLEIIDGWFLKDKEQVYHGTVPIKGSDPGSFRILDSHYAKDAAHAYFYYYPTEGGVHVIPCSIASFSVMDEYPYSKDEQSVFFAAEKIAGAAAKSFSILGNNYAKDQANVFFNNKKVTGADVNTFIVLPEYQETTHLLYYAKDNNSVYWEDKKMKGADPGSFKALDHGYGADATQVFYHGQVVKEADPASFTIYPHGMGNADSEDKKNKYWEGKKAED